MAKNWIFGYLLGPDGVGAIVAVCALFFIRSLNGKSSKLESWLASAIAIPTDLAFVAFSLYFASIGKQKNLDPWVGVFGLLYLIGFILVHFLQSCAEHRQKSIREKLLNPLLMITHFCLGLLISIIMLNTAFFEFQGG